MADTSKDARSDTSKDVQPESSKDTPSIVATDVDRSTSTLLPMLIGGLALALVSIIAVMVFE